MTEFRAASARYDITPDSPQQLSGFGPGSIERVSTGVHSPLGVTALVVDDGETTVALVSLDLLNVSRKFTAKVRERVADLDLASVTLAATHTHSAPYIPGEFLEVNPLLSYEADTTEYVDDVIDVTVTAIREATTNLEPATLRLGRAENADVLWNRRGDGPVDPELLVLLVTGESGLRTVLFNFACHPTITRPLSTLVSADWLATAYEMVRNEMDATVLFINGATGDVNARDSRTPRSDEEAYECMETVGREIGETVLSAVADARAGEPLSGDITLSRRDVSLPKRELQPRSELEEEYAALTAKIDAHGGDEVAPKFQALSSDDPRKEPLLERWYAEERIRLHDIGWEEYVTSLTFIECGELSILTAPGEVHAQHGIDFKAATDTSALLVAGYADDYISYLPTEDVFPNGGYEVRTCKFSPEAIRRFRAAAYDLL
ncbi:Neutral/alkaline non-lysosomal ceramidase, N-terminal [Halogranum amylolyticum]|uniref:Neutral/alkaline non-lysosomal ceramidase, N-terminal n=1 Tax=Halogranum amylolyticum TaxID=660520 RepID=A0A1H8UJL4_9EURY|nr:neutral/alkaline non-lysosomal ceramidase N-terminal domain-containing protein [Halogranum amylolyticum]SEP03153.1 Neutral/alkaline non-lysosomal ceramidase, N-terminal [Halogranum amylolyticum]